MKDAVATMGGLLPDDAGGRDAVHVAVASAVSDVRLRPGQDVGVEIIDGRDVKARPISSTTEGVGKVDPYLGAVVEPGQRFWLYLYPRSITGLNHNWSHPAFPNAVVGQTYVTPANKIASEQWLRDFCETTSCPGYETVMRLIREGDFTEDDDFGGHYDDDYLHFSGWSAHGEIPSEFWDHAENVLGRKLYKRPTYFSCSC